VEKKHENGKNTRRLWCKIMPKIDIEKIQRNEEFYFYLYPYEDLAQGSFQGSFYVCIE